MSKKKSLNLLEPIAERIIKLQRMNMGEIPMNILNTMDILYKDKENRPLLIIGEEDGKVGVRQYKGGWHFVFTLNPGCSFEEVYAKKDYFQSVVNGTVDMYLDGKFLHIDVNNFKFAKEYKFDAQYIKKIILTNKQYKKMDIPIVIGITSSGKLLVVDIVDIPHILVAGINKSGKSSWIKQLLWGVKLTRPNTIIFYLDFKGADAWSFEPIGFSTSEIDVARKYLSAIKEEVIKRNQFLKQNRMSKIHSLKQVPRILIGIDEITEMNDKQCQEDLFYLLRMARNTATNIVAGTQKPSHKTYKDFCESRSQFEARMSFRLAEAKDSHLVLGNDKAYTHIKPNTGGRGIWQFGEETVIQSLYISDEYINEITGDSNFQTQYNINPNQLNQFNYNQQQLKNGGNLLDEHQPYNWLL